MSVFAQTVPVERLSDERLIVLVGEGDERAFEELAHRYRGPLLRYCRRLSLSPGAAEEALQEALAEIWMALRRGTRVREPKAWLYRVVHNNAVDVARGAGRERDRWGKAGSEPGLASSDDLERTLAGRETLEALAGLPVLQREAIVRSAVGGVSHEQVARDLGVSTSAVRGLIYRARASLRKALDALIPPPMLAWLTRADVGVGAGEGSAGIAATLLRGLAVALSVGLVAGAVATHGLRSAHRHNSTPLARKAIAVPPRAHDARLGPRPTVSPNTGTRHRSGPPGAAVDGRARPDRSGQVPRALRPGTFKPTGVKAAHGAPARSASSAGPTPRAASTGAMSVGPAASPTEAGHADPASPAPTGVRAGVSPVSSPRTSAPGPATTTSNRPGPSQGATPVQGGAGTTTANGAQAGVLAPVAGHSVGETVHGAAETAHTVGETAHTVGETAAHTVGETAHTVGETAAHTVGETAHTVGETVHTVGETAHTVGETAAHTVGETARTVGETVHTVGETAAHTVGETARTVGETVQKAGGAGQGGGTTETGAPVGEAVHHVTEPVAGAGETVQKAGGALEGGGTTGQTGAVVGEAVHHVTEPVRGLAETVHSVGGGLVGAP
jgi:RNA polymerase sigma factor (sigma-70 family)